MAAAETAGIERSVRAALKETRADLDRLLRLPSISTAGAAPEVLHRTASTVAACLESVGLTDVSILERSAAYPLVVASSAHLEGQPRVLLYAHYDIVGPGDEDRWDTPPFEPFERHGRLCGRGATDDKGGIAVHLAALRAFGGKPPVNVTVLIEGEEEIGSRNLPAFIEEHGERLRSDVVVIADAGNWDAGIPGLTTSLRGSLDIVVSVHVLEHPRHSGVYGGVLPDALTVLARVLASLHDAHGDVAVKGLTGPTVQPEVEFDNARLRAESGALPDTTFIGVGPLTHRAWYAPAAIVTGIDAPPVNSATHALQPSARAVVNLRIPPGVSTTSATAAFEDHVRQAVPWGARIEVEVASVSQPASISTQASAFSVARLAIGEAWGRAPVELGDGASIPAVTMFAEAYPEAALILTGFDDRDGNPHSENESLSLREFERACLAEALLLSYLARPETSTSTKGEAP